MTTVIVSADDYGLSPAVSEGIRSLIAEGRVSATSCMTTFPGWERDGEALRGMSAELGVHLTLTDHAPLGAMPRLAPGGRLPPLGALARAASLGRLDLGEVEAELERQVARFIEVVGRPPDHLDGHHHVQQLPGVRDLVVALAARHGAWVRTCWERPLTVVRRQESVTKALALGAAGAGLRRRLVAAGVATPAGFAGSYGFGEERPYGERVRRWLIGAADGMVLMCHPGGVDEVLRGRDGLTEGRSRELAFFGSEAFLDVLAEAGARVGRAQAGRSLVDQGD
jgi:predicted glycoside hydrolase/deacetylase ChbG (UPF0249 family)